MTIDQFNAWLRSSSAVRADISECRKIATDAGGDLILVVRRGGAHRWGGRGLRQKRRERVRARRRADWERLMAWRRERNWRSRAFHTVKSGDWGDPGIWAGGRVPGIGADVVIQHDVVITL